MSVAELLDRYTYKDYSLWDGDWELIEGHPVAMAPAPMRIHQNLMTEIVYELRDSLEDECEECIISLENDWKVNQNTVVRPDVIFTCGDEGEACLTKAPKIIIEVISPSTAKNDEKIKFKIYEEEKVLFYILVYPDDLVAKAYRLEDGRYSKVGDFSHEKLVFEDLECSLALDFDKVFKRFRKR